MEYVKSLYEKESIPHKLDTYIEDFSKSLNWCHLIICRSGAGTIAENLIAGKPALMIPLLTSSDNHQMKNALYIKKIKACWIVNRNEMEDTKILQSTIKNIILDKKKLYQAAKAAKENAFINSTNTLANIGEVLIKESK